MTRLNPILAGGTALMLSVAPVLAQTDEATDGDAQVGGPPTAQAIREADAPDIGETDPVNETARTEIGGTIAQEIESFARLIYDSGYRAGYEEGLRDAQEAIVTEMRLRAEREQHGVSDLPEAGEDGQNGAGASAEETGVSGSAARSGDATAAEGEMRVERTEGGGTVIVLPPGVSPDEFLSLMMRRSGGTGQN
ncbi:hypothetical protein [Histidinibacterium lentulum]|uniref:Uncharacterized protein n=1 Tax=Histidinibacterium lentulum TaxID=2480588 RepID=A0A3N2QYQ6_9RHOB|nr:hypothetical protein [Histidinibacterium lentulum]ROU00273.1 hypothetical protein EAT49_13550 [Histidinibacterium lentulum]